MLIKWFSIRASFSIASASVVVVCNQSKYVDMGLHGELGVLTSALASAFKEQAVKMLVIWYAFVNSFE